MPSGVQELRQTDAALLKTSRHLATLGSESPEICGSKRCSRELLQFLFILVIDISKEGWQAGKKMALRHGNS